MDKKIMNQAYFNYTNSCGAANIKVKTGSLLFSHVDVAFGWNDLAFSVSHVYSTEGNILANNKCGKFWKLDAIQYVYLNNDKYCYVDGLNKVYEFKMLKNNVYGDESGTGAIMYLSGNNITIRDLKDNVMVFTKRATSNIWDITSLTPYEGVSITYTYDDDYNLIKITKGYYEVVLKYKLNKLLKCLEIKETGVVVEKINYYYNFEDTLHTIEKVLYKTDGEHSKEMTKMSYDSSQRLYSVIDLLTREGMIFNYNESNKVTKVELAVGSFKENDKSYYLNLFGEEIYLGEEIIVGEKSNYKVPSLLLTNKLQKHSFQYNTNQNYTMLTNDNQSYEYHYDQDGICTGIFKHINNGLLTLNQPLGIKLNVDNSNVVGTINYDSIKNVQGNAFVTFTPESGLASYKDQYGTALTDKITKKNYLAVLYINASTNEGVSKVTLTVDVNGTECSGSTNIYCTSKSNWQQVTIPISFSNACLGQGVSNAMLSIDGSASCVVKVSSIRLVPSSLTELYMGNGHKLTDLFCTSGADIDVNKLTFNDLLYSTIKKECAPENTEFLIYYDNLKKQKYVESCLFKENEDGNSFIPLSNDGEFKWYEQTVSDDGNITIKKSISLMKESNDSQLDIIDDNYILCLETTTTKYTSEDETTISTTKTYTDLRGKVLLEEDEYGVQSLYTNDIGFKSCIVKAKNSTNNNNSLMSTTIIETNGEVTTTFDQDKIRYQYDTYTNALLNTTNYAKIFVNGNDYLTNSFINYGYDDFNDKLLNLQINNMQPIYITREDDIILNVYNGSTENLSQGEKTYVYEYNNCNELESVTDEYNKVIYNYNHDKASRQIDTTVNGSIARQYYDNYKRLTKLEQNGYTANYSYYNSRGDSASGLLRGLEIKNNNILKQKYEYKYDENNLLKNYTFYFKNVKIEENDDTKYTGIYYTNLGTGSQYACLKDRTNNLFSVEDGNFDFKYEKSYELDNKSSKRVVTSKVKYYPDSTGVSVIVSTDNTYDEIGRVSKKVYTKSYDIELENYVQTEIIGQLSKTRSYHNMSLLPSSDAISYVEGLGNNVVYNYGYESGKVRYIDNSSLGVQYDYDSNERILKEAKYNVNSDGTHTLSGDKKEYTYDDRGNLLTITLNGNTLPTYNFEYSKDRLLGVRSSDNTYKYSAIAYDNSGNIQRYIKDGKLCEITWDNDKLLTFVQYSDTTKTTKDFTIEYTYDISGRRTSKKIDNYELTEYYYDGDKLIWEDVISYNPNTGVRTKVVRVIYTYDDSGINGIIVHDNSKEGNQQHAGYYFVKDVLGNVVEIIYNGQKVVSYQYDAWGQCTESIHSSTPNNIRLYNHILYRGYYYDYETQLYLVSSRYYSPELCRWISPDSIEYLDPESINGLNLYCYCFNDPVNYIDPDGHAPWWSWALSGLQLVGGIALCFVPGMQGLGASLAIGGASGLIMNALEPQIAQAIGGVGSIANGYGAISTGASLMGLGGWSAVAGLGLILIGAGTMAFGANEVVDAVTGTNYIQQWTGMSDSAYTWTYLGLNVASSVGTGLGQKYVQYRTRTAIYNPDGSVKQYRYYKNGSKLYDVDFNHAGTMKFPHYHGWLRNGTRLGKNHPGYLIMLLQLFGRIFR